VPHGAAHSWSEDLSLGDAARGLARQAPASGPARDPDLITSTLECSGALADGDKRFYYQTIDAAIKREGDLMTVIDVLARDVGILGVFSDWPAAVTYYANCMGLK
jgi:glycerophosphoryl diester phosphodiesterase